MLKNTLLLFTYPIIFLSRQGHLDATILLIKYGADPSIQDNEGDWYDNTFLFQINLFIDYFKVAISKQFMYFAKSRF